MKVCFLRSLGSLNEDVLTSLTRLKIKKYCSSRSRTFLKETSPQDETIDCVPQRDLLEEYI